ncbi:hypothetical protein NDU88_005552 [Pleurodeles waltl]|uniref:Uncharacterized protein n=1 Tax=Pleurodeles waltl TaxID=8319 RepID=A0AAV7RMI5_PLEWA|nr:hypothetical protein NDU88_005552 [Pleurodeles waltl]
MVGADLVTGRLPELIGDQSVAQQGPPVPRDKQLHPQKQRRKIDRDPKGLGERNSPNNHQRVGTGSDEIRNERRKSSRARPFQAQAAWEQEKAIKETSQLISNPFFALPDSPLIASDTDTGASPPSRGSLEEEGLILTPRMADDL